MQIQWRHFSAISLSLSLASVVTLSSFGTCNFILSWYLSCFIDSSFWLPLSLPSSSQSLKCPLSILATVNCCLILDDYWELIQNAVECGRESFIVWGNIIIEVFEEGRRCTVFGGTDKSWEWLKSCVGASSFRPCRPCIGFRISFLF